MNRLFVFEEKNIRSEFAMDFYFKSVFLTAQFLGLIIHCQIQKDGCLAVHSHPRSLLCFHRLV